MSSKIIKHRSGSAGGYLVGRKHTKGGIKAVNKSTGEPLEVEGGEVVITAPAVEDDTKREFEGEQLTNRQILSRINVSGGGVSFESGGEIPGRIKFDKNKTYKVGGKIMTAEQVVEYCGCGCQHEKGGGIDSPFTIDHSQAKAELMAMGGTLDGRSRDYKLLDKYTELNGKTYQDGGKIVSSRKPVVNSRNSLVVICKSVGNPDFGEDPDAAYSPTKAIPVNSLKEASEACQQYIAEWGLGGGNWTGGDVYDVSGKKVAYISYNGRIWDKRSTGDKFDQKEITAAEAEKKWYAKGGELTTTAHPPDIYFKDEGDFVTAIFLSDRALQQIETDLQTNLPGKKINIGYHQFTDMKEWASTHNFIIDEKSEIDFAKGGATAKTDRFISEISKGVSDIMDELRPWTVKYNNAFELNKAIEKLLDRKPEDKYFTDEEKTFIRYYSGYGGLEKFGAEGKGILYEYYTPPLIAEKMWGLAYKHGFKGGSVLEPAAGIGEFVKYAPDQKKLTAYEINPYSARILKILYPGVTVHNQYFEEIFLLNRNTIRGRIANLPKHDLVIGNPPYGEFLGKFAGMGEKDYTRAGNYIDYFIFRGLDLLKPGGLLIYIVGAEVAAGGKPFLQQQMNACKKEITEKSELLDAYRLPNGVFERTDVLTDIIVLKKK